MTKLTMIIELTYDETITHEPDQEGRDWFFKEVLGDDNLTLWSDEIGDEVGQVKIISTYVPAEKF